MDEGISLGLVMALVEEATGADPAVIEQAVQDWLEEHPEATTTVADGSITEQKLAAAVAAKINQVSQLSDEIDAIQTATTTDIGKALSPKTVEDGKVTEWQYKSISGVSGGAVDDVQINGQSIVDGSGVANIPVGSGKLGTVWIANNQGYGLKINSTNGIVQLVPATSAETKEGTKTINPIDPSHQHESAFYGLAKAAGDSTQSASSNTVGTYTESAKSAIHTMLSGSVAVSGTTPTITAMDGIRYVCGEVATLSITLPASGIVDVVFESGSTATVLTITPPTGVTLKWANGFDPTALEASTTYEINIADGLGVACAWS